MKDYCGLAFPRFLSQTCCEFSGTLRPPTSVKARVKKKCFTEEPIAYALPQESTGQTIAGICRKLGVSEQTYYGWTKKFGSMGVAEFRRLKQLEDENAKLKRLVADVSLDKAILQDVLRKKV